MAVANRISKEVQVWGGLGIMIVIMSIILTKFKSVGNIPNDSSTTINATIGNFVTGFQEPGNWVTIVIIAVVGFAIFRMFSRRR